MARTDDSGTDPRRDEPTGPSEDRNVEANEADVSPTGRENVAGTAQSQLSQAPPMQDPSGSNIPASNLRQPVLEGALGPSSGVAPESLDPMLMDPEKVARERAEGRTSDAANRDAGVLHADVPADINEGVKPSDGGPERYPFPPQGDVEIATVDAGSGAGEFMPALEVEDWVILDGAHDLVPERLDGRRALVLDAPRYLIPQDQVGDTWITVRTRDDVNATLHIPLSATKAIERGGRSPLVRG